MRLLALGTVWLLAAALAGCGSSETDTGPVELGGDKLDGGGSGGGGGAWNLPDSGDAAVSNPLCGVGRCDPGNPNSCPFVYPDAAADDGSDEGDADASRSEADAEAGDAQRDGAADAGAADGAADAHDAGADAEAGDARGDDERGDGEADAGAADGSLLDVASQQPTFACYIRTSASGLSRACEQPGTVGEDQTCADSGDCGVGFACVEANVRDSLTSHANRCRKLLCALPRICNDQGKFYEELPLHEGGKTVDSVLVPVCSPVDQCQLFADSCPLGKTCMIVGNNQTTCMAPGDAGVGASCSGELRCAAGLVCSKDDNRCKRLCRIGRDACNGGACQGGNKALPDGIGVCTGEIGDGG
jgi:hypothetical protein